MGYRTQWVLCLLGASLLSRASAQGIEDSSFEDRLNMYSNWANQIQSKGRSLSWAMSPQPGPTPPGPGPAPPGAGAPRPAPGPTPGNSTVNQTGFGGCKVLRYAPDPYAGYANLTLNNNVVIKDSPNFGECCKSCNADPQCLAWTRVAGGDAPNFRNCYLKYNLTDLDHNLMDARMHNHIGHIGDDIKYPELRYVDVNYPSAASPLILESGTKPDVYPPDYYGCPYESVPTTPCVAPPTCNVNGNGQFVAPPCIG